MRPLLLTVSLSVALLGCGPKTDPVASPETPGDQPLRVEQVTLHADNAGQPGNDVAQFDYRQLTQHFRAVLNQAVDGKSGTWVFTAKSTAAGNNKPIQSLQGKLDGNEIRAQLTLKTPWPVGTYHVDILVDGQSVHGFDYEVTGESTELAFLGHTLSTDNGQGQPGKSVDAFKPTDRKIHLQVTTKGVDTTEPEVIWRLYRVADGKDVELGNTAQPRMKLQDSILRAQFESAGDWKPGDYRADVLVNGKKAHAIKFSIK